MAIQPPDSKDWAESLLKMSCQEAAGALQVDPERGLSGPEAGERLERFGPNQVDEDKPNPWIQFLLKFWGLTAWMLEATVGLALLRHRPLDAGIVAALLVLNAVLGFVQEQRASRAVEALKRKLQVKVRVLRGGAWSLVEAPALVPGDLVRLRMGDFVPADLKVFSGGVQADLSALTGESEPQVAEAGDLLKSGAVVRGGEATALVLLTGARTFFGKTTQLVQTAKPKLHFEAVIGRVVKWLLALSGGLLVLAAGLWTLRGGDLLEIFPLMLILLVSAIPVALPAMFTMTLALGSVELVKRGALVTRLSAPEDAARMDVLCSDKTGTLTANRLTLAALAPLDGTGEEELLRCAMFCSQEANHDPIDLAFLNAGQERGVPDKGWRQESFTPFDPKTRRTEALISAPEGGFRVMKGALETVLAACHAAPAQEEECRGRADRFARDGYRTLAVAREGGDGFHLVGLAALVDPPRPDSRKVIETLKALGVRVKMLTGDALPVARRIGEDLGLGSRILGLHSSTGAEADAPDIDEADGFAGIYPEDKYRIVSGLQERNHVVGMTGDGVNDAPALKQAEVGVAVESATDVAKGAASVVLTREGLSAVPDLVEVGRSIHQRVETWILNKIIKTFQTLVFVVAAFLVTGRFIVSTFDMVLLLFLVDFVTLSLATDRAKGSLKPARWEVDKLVQAGLGIGLFSILEAFGLLWAGWHWFGLGAHDAQAHTFGFEILFYFGMFTVLVVREKGPFWSSRPSWPLMTAVGVDLLLAGVLATAGIPGLARVPLGATLMVAGAALVFGLFVNDRIKLLLFRGLHGIS